MLKENRYKKIKTYIYKIDNYVILLIHGWESQNLKQESSRKTGYIARYVLLVV